MFDFIEEFNRRIDMYGVDWEVSALISPNLNLYTLGSDSKLIGRIFELLVEPIIQSIADDFGYILETPEAQTVYPDFILMKNKDDKEKIAIDVKTTYRKLLVDGSVSNAKLKFALGSYASYMRNFTKNIAYDYRDFSKHYVIGLVYVRNSLATKSSIKSIQQIHEIEVPYKNVEFFVQEKYKIAGEISGSGNTENMGSMTSNNIEDFRLGKGPFSVLGKEIYEHYWCNYPKYRESNPKYLNIKNYLLWRKEKGDITKDLEDQFRIWKQNNMNIVDCDK